MRLYATLSFLFLLFHGLLSAQYSPEKMALISECVEDARRGCHVEEEKAKEVMDRILAPIGLPRNFLLVRCDHVDNAIAFIDEYNSRRYIMYDRLFLEQIENFSNHWGEIFVIAHEIGHHLSGHTISGKQELFIRRKYELEADRFASHMLFMLGATLEETMAILPAITYEYDDSESTHPTLSKRQAAVREGYDNALLLEEIRKNNSVPTVETYYIMAEQSYNNFDYLNALKYVEDCLAISETFSEAIFLRAKCHLKLGEKDLAIRDLNRVIAEQPSHTFALSQRGILAYRMGELELGCQDLIKACSMGHQLSCDNYQRFCK